MTQDLAERKLIEDVQLLVRRFSLAERAEVSCCGLTVTQAVTLSTLHRDGPLRMGSLGQRLGVSPSTLTRNLDRLFSSGLLVREPDEEDARAARVRLTASGNAVTRKLEDQELNFSRSILMRIPEGQRADVLSSLSVLLTAIRDATEDCCPGAFDNLTEEVLQAPARIQKGNTNEQSCK